MLPILHGLTELKLRSRTIILKEVVDDDSVVKVIREILTINEEDEEDEKKFISLHNTIPIRKPIVIEIQSVGGVVRDGLALIATIEQSKTPIITRVNGYAYSMALTIFLAGHERHMSRHAVLMYHQVSGFAYGTLRDMEERLDVTKDLQEQLEDYVIERTKWKRKDLNKIYSKKQDYYLRPDEALASGFITKII